MPRSRPPSSPRSCSLTPGGRQTVLGKHSEHQHIRLRDRPTDRPRPTECPGAHPDGVGDALAQRSLDVPAEDLLLAVVVHPPLAETGAGQRVQAAGFGRPQHTVELQRRWRKSKFHLSFIRNESATTNMVYFSIFKGSPAAPNSPCRWPALRACQTGWRRGVRFRRASPGRASRLDTAASQRSRRSPSTVGCSPRI